MRQLVRARCTRAALTTSTPAKGIDTSTHSDQMPVHNSPILVTRGVVEREWLLIIIINGKVCRAQTSFVGQCMVASDVSTGIFKARRLSHYSPACTRDGKGLLTAQAVHAKQNVI